MSGESRGLLAEAIAKVALDLAVSQLGWPDQVYWGDAPREVIVQPDLLIGNDASTPRVIILVNASENVSNSHMKFWRNVSEVFDAKSRMSVRPTVLNLVFKSAIKPELLRLAEIMSDHMHVVDEDPIHGAAIVLWLDSNHATLGKKNRATRERLVRNAVDLNQPTYDHGFSSSVNHLALTLAQRLELENTTLDGLWDLITSDFEMRHRDKVREMRTTLLRRGVSRWLVLDIASRHLLLNAHFAGRSVLKSNLPDYVMPLGLVRKVIGGVVLDPNPPKDSDMVSSASNDLHMAAKFFHNATGHHSIQTVATIESTLSAVPKEMEIAADLLRRMPRRVESWNQQVLANWDNLVTPAGCFSALTACWEDTINRPNQGDQPGNRVWIYDHLVALLRANAGRNNDFGYGAMVSYFKERLDDPRLKALLRDTQEGLTGREHANAKRWVEKTLPNSAEPGRRGFQDWLAGKRQLTPVIIAAFAFSLSGCLSTVKDASTITLAELVSRHAYGLWNKLLTHQDFEPLADLIKSACGDKVTRSQLPTVLVDLAGETGLAGYVDAFVFERGLIMWQSVTDAGKDHKRKELAGRVRAVKYALGRSGFFVREGVERLLLVIDGSFSDSDLRILYDSGWDDFFYPDEMDRLQTSIA